MEEPVRLAHLHAQESEHDEAYLLANDAAMLEIMRAMGEAYGTKGAAIAKLMTADGDGFELVVICENAPWGSDVWKLAKLPYSPERVIASGVGPWDHPMVRKEKAGE